MKHTPTPWTIFIRPYAEDNEVRKIQTVDHQIEIASRVDHFDAERIVSCVNALEGIENPEAIKELIEAAKNLRDWCDNNLNGVPVEYGKCMEAVDRALANLKKGE